MRIVKRLQNTVVLQLHDIATTANPQWLFRLTHSLSGHTKVFAAEDDSDFTERYSLFRITESSNEDLSNGVVSLVNSGQYTYEVFEMAESSPRNLDPADALKTVRTGICEVVDESENQTNFFTENEDKDTGVFDIE